MARTRRLLFVLPPARTPEDFGSCAKFPRPTAWASTTDVIAGAHLDPLAACPTRAATFSPPRAR